MLEDDSLLNLHRRTVAALVALVAQTLSIMKDYLSSIKHKKDSVVTLVTEFEALQFNHLSSLDAFLRSDAVRVHTLTFQRTSVSILHFGL